MRVTLRGVMFAVAVAAANLGLLRAAGPRAPDLLLVAGPPVVLLQVAGWRAAKCRRPGRAFWVGYLLLGSLATGTLLWGETHRAVHGRLPSGRIGVIQPASPFHHLWQGYFLSVANAARPYRPLVGWIPGSGFLLALLGTYGPQIGTGVLGGWIGGWARRHFGRLRHGPAADASVASPPDRAMA